MCVFSKCAWSDRVRGANLLRRGKLILFVVLLRSRVDVSRFVSDENLVHFLLDEVVNSAVNRSVQSELMESSIVEVICDRG